MRLTLGIKVFYPAQGLCLIGPVVKKVIDGKSMRFCQLVVLNNGGDLFIPVDKLESVGIRPLVKKSEIPHLLDCLTVPAQPPDDYRRRVHDNAMLFASGSAYDLAEVVSSLTTVKRRRALSYGENRTLHKAKSLLIWEISEVMGQTEEEAEEQLERALESRK